MYFQGHEDKTPCSIPNVMDLEGESKPCGQVILAQAESYVTKICCALVSIQIPLQIEANAMKPDTCPWEGIKMKRGSTMSPSMPSTMEFIFSPMVRVRPVQASVLFLPTLHFLKAFS